MIQTFVVRRIRRCQRAIFAALLSHRLSSCSIWGRVSSVSGILRCPRNFEFIIHTWRIRRLEVERFPVLQATTQKLRPRRHSHLRIDFLRKETPQLGMVPAHSCPVLSRCRRIPARNLDFAMPITSLLMPNLLRSALAVERHDLDLPFDWYANG
jgi:hypothetical protein